MKNVGSVWSPPARRALERRLARVLGMDAALARELMAAAWPRGDHRRGLRAAAFMAATTPLSPAFIPRRLRERIIRGFVRRLFAWRADDPRLALAYAGHRDGLGSESCPRLLPP